MRRRPGLLAKAIVLLALVFAVAVAALHHFYVPWLEERVGRQLVGVADDCLEESQRLMQRRAFVLADRNRRNLLDLPYELSEGDAVKTRQRVDEYARGFGRSYTLNAVRLTQEFRLRLTGRIGQRASDLSAESGRSARTGLIGLLLAALALMGLGLARIVVAPLGRLVRATERVAEGRLDTAVGLTGGDEVGRLGRAFDQMTEALRASRAEIEELNRGLEDKVREKTAELHEKNAELSTANERLLATISELGETRDALVHSHTMASIGTLAGGVAHEFNNLLGGIIGCAEDARAEDDPDDVRAGLDMILRTARRACNVTENLLRFSRPPSRELRETEIHRLVSEAVDLVGPETRSRGIEVETSLFAVPPVNVDPGQIHQVVLNLLTNAIHAMPGGGKLTVGVAREGEHTLVRVRDTGVGIRAEHRSRIFEPFFTTREGDRDAKGTGLGLSVSYSIVKAHGGEIEVESVPGRGSLFTVRLTTSGEEA